MHLLHDHGFVHGKVAELQHHLAAHETAGGLHADGRHVAPHELAAIREALEQGRQHEARPGPDPYLARDPLISLVQSSLHEHAVNKLGSEAVARGDAGVGDAFTPADIAGWGVDIGLSLIRRLLHGSHRFEDHPAVADLDDTRARLVLFGDWGTGMADAAGKVIDQVRRHVEPADGEVHVVHLGDTYYSGTPLEARKHVLDLWPVTARESDRVGSWALNGNHDMYSGGYGYFDTVLGDPRFGRQRSHGRPTSWFHLKGRRTWDVIGLDTAYQDPVAAFHAGHLFLFGRLGFLHGSQAAYVNDLGAGPHRRLLLLSHHQLFSAYDSDINKDNVLRDRLRPALDRTVDAWFWGHEHNCLAYEPFRGVTAARVIGHGALPTQVRTEPPGTTLDEPHRVVKPTPPAGAAPDHPVRAVRWEYRDYDEDEDGRRWAKHGYAVVDMSPGALRVRHIDENGEVYVDETI